MSPPRLCRAAAQVGARRVCHTSRGLGAVTAGHPAGRVGRLSAGGCHSGGQAAACFRPPFTTDAAASFGENTHASSRAGQIPSFADGCVPNFAKRADARARPLEYCSYQIEIGCQQRSSICRVVGSDEPLCSGLSMCLSALAAECVPRHSSSVRNTLRRCGSGPLLSSFSSWQGTLRAGDALATRRTVYCLGCCPVREGRGCLAAGRQRQQGAPSPSEGLCAARPVTVKENQHPNWQYRQSLFFWRGCSQARTGRMKVTDRQRRLRAQTTGQRAGDLPWPCPPRPKTWGRGGAAGGILPTDTQSHWWQHAVAGDRPSGGDGR